MSLRAAYIPYPFATIVGQEEAKLALLLAAINPRVGGVLFSGPKGTGKTTLVRAVAELLPELERATCPYGCDPKGTNLCAECAATLESGATLEVLRSRSEIVELPVNAQLDDVVGAIDLRAALERNAVAFRPGLLARAHRNLLYVDEINLLSDVAVDALLDAAAQGVVHVKRGQHAIDYPSRFTLIGTMNPEEGELRPQITDRIGLRVFIRPESEYATRLEIYRRNASFARDPRAFAAAAATATKKLREQMERAANLLGKVRVGPDAERVAIEATTRLGIDSHRTELTALEAACALAAWEKRTVVEAADVERVFPLAARLRRSRLKVEALSEHVQEDAAIEAALAATMEAGDAGDPQTPEERAPGIVVSPELTQRAAVKKRPQTQREGQPVAVAPLAGGRLDVPATLVDRKLSRAAGVAPDPKESIDAAKPPRLTVLVVDASLSTRKSAELVKAAIRELLRPIYTERERAALVSCWGRHSEIVVDEQTGRNVDLVASRIADLDPGEAKALTPLPEALELVRRITERFRRAHAGAEIDVAVFSDGRANVPLGDESELLRALETGDTRALVDVAAEQCRALAATLAGRAELTFINLDEYEAYPLMRELAAAARGRYFALTAVVAKIG